MQGDNVEHYSVRCGYGSDELLIEFVPKVADKEFLEVLLGVLNEIGTRVADIEDVWMNDEVLLKCTSDHGAFVLTVDVWDLVFILAPDNQKVIARIDETLDKSGKFQKRRKSE